MIDKLIELSEFTIRLNRTNTNGFHEDLKRIIIFQYLLERGPLAISLSLFLSFLSHPFPLPHLSSSLSLALSPIFLTVPFPPLSLSLCLSLWERESRSY